MKSAKKPLRKLISALVLAGVATAVQAANWSDTLVGMRYGQDFREPNNREDIEKKILQFTHASGYNYGQNFMNLDIFQSDDKDPANGSTDGATEFYLTYRHQLHLGKIFEKDLSFGPVKEVALTGGFDLNTKNTKFAPRKRLMVFGPTLKLDVPGFWDISLLYGKEWNHCGLGAPACPEADMAFDPQWIISTSWGVPFALGPVPLKFQGFLNYNSAKGKDYAGVDTKAETLMRAALMVDVGQMVAGKKNTFLMGIGYEHWHNKFGNHATAKGVQKPGINTDAPMLQVEWHF